MAVKLDESQSLINSNNIYINPGSPVDYKKNGLTSSVNLPNGGDPVFQILFKAARGSDRSRQAEKYT